MFYDATVLSNVMPLIHPKQVKPLEVLATWGIRSSDPGLVKIPNGYEPHENYIAYVRCLDRCTRMIMQSTKRTFLLRWHRLKAMHLHSRDRTYLVDFEWTVQQQGMPVGYMMHTVAMISADQPSKIRVIHSYLLGVVT